MSRLLFKSRKEQIDDLFMDRLYRGAFVIQECSGIFSYTNLGLRIINKISNRIRQELDVFCQEVALPNLQDAELWKLSGRYASYGEEKFKLTDRKKREMFLAPTAEESATLLVNTMVQSYKSLPVCIYQIKEKYRDELRPRFGLIRSRQFIMKDAYSYASSEQEAYEIYFQFFKAYENIFKSMNLKTIAVPADTGEIGGDFSHEFVVLNEHGESDVFFSAEQPNIETIKDFDKLTNSFTPVENYQKSKAIELGHLFHLGATYSAPMKANFTNKNGDLEPFIMGCYGIGVSRILALALNIHKFLPKSIAPFLFHIIYKRKNAEEVYGRFCKEFGEQNILFDQDESIGSALNNADLIGIPQRIIIAQSIEYYEYELNGDILQKHIFITEEDLYVFLKTQRYGII